MKRVIFGIMAILTVLVMVSCPESSPSPAPKPTLFTVTFDANGGTGTVAAITQKKAGDPIEIPGPGTMTKANSVFAGWSTTAAGTATLFAGDEYKPTANTKLYAVWGTVGGPATIIFNVNGGTGTVANVTGTIGTPVALPGSPNNPPTGVTGPSDKPNFLGWARAATDTEPDVSSPFTPAAASTTLYAVWSAHAAVVATVSYDANGGTGTMTATATVVGATIQLPQNGFTAPSGKKFKGWGATATATTVKAPGDPLDVETAAVTIYAIWEDESVGPGPGEPETGTDRSEYVAQTNNWFSMYRMVIPEGYTWADYAYLKVSYMFDAEHLATARARNGRIYGPYEPEDFSFLTGTTDGKMRAIANLNNQNATHILDDAGLGNSSTAGALLTALAAKGINPVANQWFTCGEDFYKIDGSRKNGSYTDAKLAALMASTGVLYMTVGLPAGGNGDPANEYWIRDITLVGLEGVPNVVATSLYFEYNGVEVPAYLGYPTTDGSNGWDDSYRVSVDDTKTVVPSAKSVEKVHATNNWFTLYKFVIPSDKTFADYKAISADYMFKAEDLATARARNGRIYGPYDEEADLTFLVANDDDTDARFIANLNNQNATHILDDAGLGNSSAEGALLTALQGKGINPVGGEFFTCGEDFYKIDGSRKNGSYTDAKLAALMAATGDLIMGIGLPAGGNGDPANVFYIKNIKLIGLDPADTIYAVPFFKTHMVEIMEDVVTEEPVMIENPDYDAEEAADNPDYDVPEYVQNMIPNPDYVDEDTTPDVPELIGETQEVHTPTGTGEFEIDPDYPDPIRVYLGYPTTDGSNGWADSYAEPCDIKFK